MEGKIENIDSVNDNELKMKLRNTSKIIDYYLMQNPDSNSICSENNLTNETPVIDNNRISTTSAVSIASSSSSTSTSTSTSTESESKQLSSRFRSYLNERSEYYDEYEKQFNSSKRFSIQRLLSMRRKHFQRNDQSNDSKYPYQKTTYVRKLTKKFEKLAHDNCSTSTPTKLGIITNTNTVTNKYSRSSSSSSSSSSGNSQFYVNNNEENHEKIPLSKSPLSLSSLSSSSTIGTQKKFHSKNNYKILRESDGKSNKNINWKTNVENRRESNDSNEKQGELREVYDDNDDDDDDDECSITSTSTTNTSATTTTDEYYETCDMSDEVEKQKQQNENSLQSDNETFNTNQKNQFKNESETDKDPLEKENSNESTNIPGILVEEFSDCVNINQEYQQQSSYLLPRDLTNNGNCSNFDKLRDKLKDDQRLIGVNKRKSAPIPKLNLDRVCETTNRHITSKSLSCYPSDSDSDDENNFENSYSLRSSKLSLFYESKDITPIIEELIITEQKYIENLKIGIQNYGGLFTKMNSVNLPMGLKGKKWVLLGNIEQIYEFHDIEFLPMLLRNQYNLIGLFDEFMKFLNEHCFYSYVLYTMNKKRSMKLREQYRQYFKEVQEEIDDKLGINSFLVQPIQRLARYPLLLQQLIMTCFKTGNIKYKPIIELCCKVEKRIRNLLTTTNEAEEINDIKECYEINILHQGKFKKMNEFTIYDYTQRRSYRSKVFIFDNCLLYTEIRDKLLIYRGYYPCNLIGFIAKQKSFTLYYHKQKCQECEFTSDKNIIEQWIELIRDMINVFAEEEKRRLKEKYLNKKSDIYRRSGDVSMLRTPSRLSTDSFTGSVFSSSSTTSSSSSSSLSITSTPLSFTTNPAEEMSKKTTWYDNDYDT